MAHAGDYWMNVTLMLLAIVLGVIIWCVTHDDDDDDGDGPGPNQYAY